MNIDGLYINYIDYGNNKGSILVFLHGWGQNIEMMKILGDYFSKENRIVILDLPGFGKSNEPTSPWYLTDYIDLLRKFFKELNIVNPILIGHSFGGKLSLLYASEYEVKKLIVMGSPFKKEIKTESLKLKTLKFLKRVPLVNKLEGFAKKHIGSRDYKASSNIMRQILVNHVNEDITEHVKKINAPTIIIWGEFDKEVPLSDAYILESLISGSAVIVYPKGTHYAYLENLNQTVNIINSFINS